jgi:nicotinate-nucleotide adenylyltransferase
VAPIGILGGTFNPPHRGHLALARFAGDELELERVVLMPAHNAPNKSPERDPGAARRLQMCRLLAEDVPGVLVCDLEIERGGRSYTVDTLQTIHEGHSDARLTFIVGADVALTLGTWREPQRVLELARLAVAMRAGSSSESVLDAVKEVDAGADVALLAMKPIDVSSSLVRARVQAGEPIEALVGARVAGYIAEQGLYRGVPVAEVAR